MNETEFFYKVLVAIQLLHSQEEIHMGFAKRWPIWKMSQKTFVTFEVIASILLLIILFNKDIAGREVIMLGFNLLMFANGIWHLMWAGAEKKYVPGLITAPLFVITFIIFYFRVFN